MTTDKGNVIMFPRWQQNLEDKTVQLINDKNFVEALNSIDELIYHNASTFNTNMLKLLCHVELGQYEEAIEFCESVLMRDDPDYYAYLEFYLTILYQTNKFEQLMDVYEEEKEMGTIPNQLKERFQELYKLSYQMIQQKRHSDSLSYLKQLRQMIDEGNERGQWEFVNGLRKIKANPPQEVIQLLTSDKVHPITKTTIFNWLKECNFNELVKVKKFGETITIKPEEAIKLGKHPILKKTLFYLVDIEQENPSLYELIEDLLVRYTYVKYPIFYSEEDAYTVAKALIHIGKTNLQLPIQSDNVSNEVNEYIKDINKCNELYLKIIER